MKNTRSEIIKTPIDKITPLDFFYQSEDFEKALLKNIKTKKDKEYLAFLSKAKKDYLKKIKELTKNKDVISIYVYGSSLRPDFKLGKSDIDLLVVYKDTRDSFKKILKANTLFRAQKNKLWDVNICFESELIRKVHVDRPMTYYLWIKKTGRHLYGKKILDQINFYGSYKEITKRTINLAQRARHTYLNGRDPEFWQHKLRTWILILISEILYLETKDIELDYKQSLKRFIQKNPNFKYFKCLMTEDSLRIKKIMQITEDLKNYVLKK